LILWNLRKGSEILILVSLMMVVSHTLKHPLLKFSFNYRL
jgi:hypothetical protein